MQCTYMIVGPLSHKPLIMLGITILMYTYMYAYMNVCNTMYVLYICVYACVPIIVCMYVFNAMYVCWCVCMPNIALALCVRKVCMYIRT